MRKLIVSEFVTLDGVMQAPGGPDEDRSGGFDAGGWQMNYFDDVFGKIVLEGLSDSDFLLGRRTYEIFAAYWPKAPADDPVAPIMNGAEKYVVSTTLPEPLAWEHSHLLRDTIGIGELKAQHGKDLRVIGSGELVQSLMQEDLVDEYALMIHPLVVGGGKRLFRDGNPRRPLRLVDSMPTGSGVLIATYAPDR